MLAEFYGLSATTMDVQEIGRQNSFPIIAVASGTLAGLPSNGQTIIRLRRAVESWAKLLVLDVKGERHDKGAMAAISALMDGQVP